jgi:hypothetical protein
MKSNNYKLCWNGPEMAGKTFIARRQALRYHTLITESRGSILTVNKGEKDLPLRYNSWVGYVARVE